MPARERSSTAERWRGPALAAGLWLAALAFGSAAQAQTSLCNHTSFVLSAAVAVRGTNESSAAVDGPAPRRIPLAELAKKGGVHSRDCALLINTGCLVIDIRETWAEKLYFHVKDGIRRLSDGTFAPFVEPEDWELSRSLRRMGVPFATTAAVETLHAGVQRWSSRQ